MLLDDPALGKLILIVFGLLYLYYTLWIYALPFAEDEDYLALFFPSIRYALIIPATIGTLFIGSIILFIIYTFYFT